MDLTYTLLDDHIDFVSVELQLSVSQLYRRIDFTKKRKKQR